MEKRIPFQVKMPEQNYNKMKSEAEKLWLTMSSFINMLVFTYDSTVINTMPLSTYMNKDVG